MQNRSRITLAVGGGVDVPIEEQLARVVLRLDEVGPPVDWCVVDLNCGEVGVDDGIAPSPRKIQDQIRRGEGPVRLTPRQLSHVLRRSAAVTDETVILAVSKDNPCPPSLHAWESPLVVHAIMLIGDWEIHVDRELAPLVCEELLDRFEICYIQDGEQM